ncbi:MAG: Ig-like domain-containing protein [Candidatus Staskawiczbacteria bacterium]|nr:Ig-like domain-containing protein [Candidatus Staskawiczbacteria bacterium]
MEKITIRKIIKEVPPPPPKPFLRRVFSSNNVFFSIFVGLIFAGVFCTGVYVLAVTYGVDATYPAGNTLDPTNCNPGDTYCKVTAPVPYTGAATAVDLGTQNFTTTGTLGAGAITGTTLAATAAGGITLGTDVAAPTVNIPGYIKMFSAGKATANSQALLSSTAGVLSWGTDFGANNITTTGTGTFGSATRKTILDDGVYAINATGIMTLNGSSNQTQINNTALGGPVFYYAYVYENLGIGRGASVSGQDATAVGGQFATAGTYAVAFGSYAYAGYEGSIAIGYSATVNTPYGTAIGYSAQAYDFAVAIGQYAAAAGDYSIAIGQYSYASNRNEINFSNQDSTYGTLNGSNGGYTQLDIYSGVANFQKNSITTTGKGTFTGGIVTKDNASAPTLPTTNGTIQVGLDGSANRLYFYSNGAQKYINANGSFDIPGSETIDPISGEQMQVGDFVIGMLDKNVGDSENSIHGVWTKLSSVLAELQANGGSLSALSASGVSGTGSVAGVSTETLLGKVTNVLTSLGISIKDGVTSIATLATEKFTTKTARMDKIEMVDKATGDIYCTWIENGEWQKAKGECSTISISNTTPVAAPVITPETSAAQQAQNAVSQQATQAAAQAAQRTAAAAQQAAEEVQSLDIASIASILDVNVAYGSLPTLPATVSATLSGGIAANPDVVWDSGTPAFDANTPETYVFSGTPTTTSGIANTQNLTATVNVIVAPQPAPVPEEQPPAENPAPGVSDLIQQAASSLTSGIFNFAKWLFVNPVKQLSSSQIFENTAAGLSRSVQTLGAFAASILSLFNNFLKF